MSQYCDLPPTKNYIKPRRWLVSDLWKESDTMQAYEEDVDRLWELYKNRFCWTLYGEDIDNEFFLNHMKRILMADLNYAIILTEEDYIMDGVHRLLKCKYLGRKKILCVKFKKDPPSIK
jgi:hypothetical protein